MKIKILGTIGMHEKSARKHSKRSGILIDDKILFDLGEKEYLIYKPDYIFLTHLHPDHAIFIEEEIFNIEIPVHAPNYSKRLPDLKIIREEVNLDSYKITPIPTHHSKSLDSVAYLIENNQNNRILYTGDLIWIDKEYHYLLENLDLIIADGSFLRKGGMTRKDSKTGQLFGHNGIPDLIKFLKPFTNKIVFTHFGSWFFEDIEKSKKEIISLYDSINIEVAYDGMEINL
ncbi:MAG: Ribonuclease Z [Promethearchaeota archaeon]|nr:MAG: Ribonuclease Z [Candidatus Lokiarchaeota archaeon]